MGDAKGGLSLASRAGVGHVSPAPLSRHPLTEAKTSVLQRTLGSPAALGRCARSHLGSEWPPQGSAKTGGPSASLFQSWGFVSSATTHLGAWILPWSCQESLTLDGN